jgi:hypothetical protein
MAPPFRLRRPRPSSIRGLLIGAVLVAGAPARSEPPPAGDHPDISTIGRPDAPGAHTVVRTSLEASAYHDSDHVNVATPTLAASIADPVAGWSIGGSYLLDAVSAASVDITSSASPPWKEVRHVVAGNFHYKPHDFGIDGGGGISREPDYVAIAGGGTLSLDLFEKNLTLIAGYSYGDETAGRSVTSFSVYSNHIAKNAPRLGLTLILDPSSVLDVVGEASLESGNQAKPYRYVPLFSPAVAARLPAGASISEVNGVRSGEKAIEQVPLDRKRFAVTTRLSHRFPGAALRIEERLYSDDWNMKASTTDARVVADLGRHWFLWPHLRAHFQSPVSFWQRAYEVETGPGGSLSVPFLRTGDRELGPLRSLTAGGGLRFKLDSASGRTWILTLQGDAVLTTYYDALYIQQRASFFGALGIETAVE